MACLAYGDHFEISLPSKMVLGDAYVGYVRGLDVPDNYTLTLTSNSSSVALQPAALAAGADQQSVSFTVFPSEPGTFKVVVTAQDRVSHDADFTVYGKDSVIDDPEETGIRLWLPSDVIAGERYSGYVLLDRYSPVKRIIAMAGGNADLPEYITVLPHEHSALFWFVPLEGGSAFVAAATDGESSLQRTMVHGAGGQGRGAMISLYSHNSTSTGTLAVVVSLEGAGRMPLGADGDVTVSLHGTHGVAVPDSVIIQAGGSQGVFLAAVEGAGTITALAPGYEAGTISVGRSDRDPRIRIGAAPSPALQGAVAYYFVWLEDERGRLHREPGVTEVFLTSTRLDVASFQEGVSATHGIESVPMVNGMHGGMLFTGRAGSADITASTSGYGSDTVRMNVGPQLVGGGCGADRRADGPGPAAARLTLDIMPDTTDGPAYGVVAQYAMRDARDEDGGSACVVEPDEIGPYSGASRKAAGHAGRLSGGADRIVVSSSGGVEHEPVIDPGESQRGGRYRGAILFEVYSAEPGVHRVSVSADNHSMSGIPEPPAGEGRLRASAGGPSAVFSVQEGGASDAITFVGVPVPDGGGISGIAGVSRGGSVIPYGMGSAGGITLERYGDQYVVHAGQREFSGTLTAGSLAPLEVGGAPGGGLTIRLEAPDAVRANEPFPYHYHLYQNGVPVAADSGGRISLPDSVSSLGANELLQPEAGGFRITAISDAGTSSVRMTADADPLDFEITGAPAGPVSVGEDFLVVLDSPVDGLQYVVTTAIPNAAEGGAIRFTPHAEGNYTVSVAGKRAGFGDAAREFDVVVEETVDVYVESAGAKNVPFEMTMFGRSQHATPLHFSAKPGAYGFAFPAEHTDDAGGYRFDVMEYGPSPDSTVLHAEPSLQAGIETDLYIVAHYVREIRVDVQGGSGGGVYAIGETVYVRAEDREVVPLLIYERFDGWEGLDSDEPAATFAAEHDISITAEYYTDHTAWMAITAAGTGAALAAAALRRSARAVWFLRNLPAFGGR